MVDFSNSAKAIAEYDANDSANALDKALENAHTNDEVDAAFKHHNTLLDKVGDAFFEDTKEYNSLDSCRIVARTDLAFIRRLVAHYNP